jgi:alkylation response protein AidB-like acyl-CoA dehydrogenase
MAVETAPTHDSFALSEEERQVRDTVREWAQREVAPGAASETRTNTTIARSSSVPARSG